MKSVGKIAKANRKTYRLSQFEVEERTKISKYRLSQIENGRGAPPSIAEAAQLADLFKDIRIVRAACNYCQIHKVLYSLAARDFPDIQTVTDLTRVSGLFVSSIRDCCDHVIDTSICDGPPTAMRERSLLIVEETKRIRFLADALGLLAEQVG